MLHHKEESKLLGTSEQKVTHPKKRAFESTKNIGLHFGMWPAEMRSETERVDSWQICKVRIHLVASKYSSLLSVSPCHKQTLTSTFWRWAAQPSNTFLPWATKNCASCPRIIEVEDGQKLMTQLCMAGMAVTLTSVAAEDDKKVGHRVKAAPDGSCRVDLSHTTRLWFGGYQSHN